MLNKIKETTAFIKDKVKVKPLAGIVLGTGLGGLAKVIKVNVTLPYSSIPNFLQSTVEGHSGNLIFGELCGKQVVAMQGRLHYYEGYSLQDIALPIRVMKMLGIEFLFLSNASGGVNPDYAIGDLMILSDHINTLPSNPLIGRNIDELGERFPDMSDAYDKKLIAKAKQIAAANNIKVHTGVYAVVSGPSLETPAEYKYYRIIGADTVGMSTVPEVIAARQMRLPCFAISVITDLGVPGKIVKVSLEDVIRAAGNSEPDMTLIIRELITSL